MTAKIAADLASAGGFLGGEECTHLGAQGAAFRWQGDRIEAERRVHGGITRRRRRRPMLLPANRLSTARFPPPP